MEDQKIFKVPFHKKKIEDKAREVIKFGKYKGETWGSVLVGDEKYIEDFLLKQPTDEDPYKKRQAGFYQELLDNRAKLLPLFSPVVFKGSQKSIKLLSDVIMFGKVHKGRTYEEVAKTDPQYLHWIFMQSSMNDVIKAKARAAYDCFSSSSSSSSKRRKVVESDDQ